LLIKAGQAERQYWHDLWLYRELFYVLAWRDVAVKYKQTALGILWAVLQPVITTAIFTVIFGRLAKVPSEGLPYPLLVLAGMLPWQFFAAALTNSSQSLVSNAQLISKTYFPRIIVPSAATVTSMVDFLITFGLVLVMMAWYHIFPTWRFVALPFLMVLAFFTALGPGLFITALNVKYRDFRYIMPFFIQIGVYVSPAGFPSTIVDDKWWAPLYALNPMVGVIDAFRWALLGGRGGITLETFSLSLAVTILLLIAGTRYFRATEQNFADII
jgi:lipopolysaccharide transport system permease protein